MLVLARMRDESIMIGDDIEVKVSDIRGDRVRLGISAPKHVKVHRKEIYDQIQQENQDAAGLPADAIGAMLPAIAEHEGMKIIPRARDPFLVAAIAGARQSLDEGGLPIGAVLIRGDQIIGAGHDRRVQTSDPTAVAEIECLRNAGRQPSFGDVTLYTTFISGPMTVGMIRQLGIQKVMVGDRSVVPSSQISVPGTIIIDLRDQGYAEMLRNYIQGNHERWITYQPK